MRNITAEYKESEFGWVTDLVKLCCNTTIVIRLKKRGVVVVKEASSVDAPRPKVLVTPMEEEFEINYDIDMAKRSGKECHIQIITSEEPEEIVFSS